MMKLKRNQPTREENILAVINALVHDKAAILVGAGFSKNAVLREESSDTFTGGTPSSAIKATDHIPDWGEIAASLDFKDRNKEDLKNIPRLSDIWMSQKGNTRQLLQQKIIKAFATLNLFKPGPCHQLLLDLGWSDIFTTNYDTFLEDAAKDNELRYSLIAKEEDFSYNQGWGRIIKLHGTLPGLEKFIFTEEDFRTYKDNFRVFSNIIRSVMISHTFCFIGFSGVDPNFLDWTGSIRDWLPTGHPPMYMFHTGQAMRLCEVELLRSRNIQIIDILENNDDFSDYPKYPYYVKRFLERLSKDVAAQKPFAFAIEPNLDRTPFAIPANEILASPLQSYRGLIDEAATQGSEASGNQDMLKSIKSIRQGYPGWLMPPLQIFNSIWNVLFFRYSKFAKAYCDQPVKKCKEEDLLLLRELIWIFDFSAMPFPDKVIVFAEELMEKFKVRGTCPEVDIEIASAFNEIASVLLRHYREEKDAEKFTTWHRFFLDAQSSHISPGKRNNAHYQKIMYDIERFDMQGALKKLQDWNVETHKNSASFWPTCKAALLAELGETDAAYSLALKNLQAIRGAIGTNEHEPQNQRNSDLEPSACGDETKAIARARRKILRLTSFEQWTEIYLEWMHRGQETNPNSPLPSEIRPSRPEMKGSVTHPQRIIEGIKEEIRNARNTQVPFRPRNELVNFDIGDIKTRYNTNYYSELSQKPFYSFLRLMEATGLPIRVAFQFGDVCVDGALDCLELGLFLWNGFTRPMFNLILRSAAPKAFVDDKRILFSRTALAMIPMEGAKNVTENVLTGLRKLLKKSSALSKPKQPLPTHIEFALEFLSRMQLAVPTEVQAALLDEAVKLYCDSGIIKFPELYAPYGRFLTRLLKGASPATLRPRTKKLIDLPVMHEAQYRKNDASWLPQFSQWHDPIDGLPDILTNINGHTSEWAQSAERLLDKAETINERIPTENRNPQSSYFFHAVAPAWRRLFWLANNKLLPESTLKQLAPRVMKQEGIWSPPDVPGFYPWAWLQLSPSGSLNTWWSSCKAFLFSKLDKASTPDEKVKIINLLVTRPPKLTQACSFSDFELEQLIQHIFDMDLARLKYRSDILFPEPNPFNRLIWTLCWVFGGRLKQLNLPRSKCKAFLDALKSKLRDHEATHYRLDVLSLIFGKSHKKKVIESLEGALFTGNENAVDEACAAILLWRGFIEKDLPTPPEVKLLLARAFRLQEPPRSIWVLKYILRQLESYFNMKESLSAEEQAILMAGLAHHYDLLRYTPDDEGGTIKQTEIAKAADRRQLALRLPEYRLHCAELVFQLCTLYPATKSEKTISQWLKDMRTDPLSDLRNLTVETGSV